MGFMTIGRRNFLKVLASTVALASVATKKKDYSDVEFNPQLVSILLGPAFDGQAEFSIVHGKTGSVRYLVYNGNQFIQEATYLATTKPYSNFRIDKFLFTDLPIDSTLTLRVYNNDQLIDERLFSSVPSNRPNYNIGLASCMRAAQHEKNMWDSLETQKADLLLFLGDCAYVDFELEEPVTPQLIWKKFVETRMVLQFYQWKRLVPVVAIWDDHDFGGNDSNSTFAFVNETQENFKSFFAQNLSESSFISAGPGISCKFQLGDQLFLMLDGRSFRLPSNTGQLNSFFGKEQEDWIFNSIKDFNGLIWMNNGTQWFNYKGYGESFRRDHTLNFNMFMEKLNHFSKPVIFTSGDVHFSEVCKTPKLVNKSSVEITSSCMHSSTFFALPILSNSEGQIDATWRQNYVICSTEQYRKSIYLEVRCYGKRSQPLFETSTEYSIN